MRCPTSVFPGSICLPQPHHQSPPCLPGGTRNHNASPWSLPLCRRFEQEFHCFHLLQTAFFTFSFASLQPSTTHSSHTSRQPHLWESTSIGFLLPPPLEKLTWFTPGLASCLIAYKKWASHPHFLGVQSCTSAMSGGPCPRPHAALCWKNPSSTSPSRDLLPMHPSRLLNSPGFQKHILRPPNPGSDPYSPLSPLLEHLTQHWWLWMGVSLYLSPQLRLCDFWRQKQHTFSLPVVSGTINGCCTEVIQEGVHC